MIYSLLLKNGISPQCVSSILRHSRSTDTKVINVIHTSKTIIPTFYMTSTPPFAPRLPMLAPFARRRYSDRNLIPRCIRPGVYDTGRICRSTAARWIDRAKRHTTLTHHFATITGSVHMSASFTLSAPCCGHTCPSVYHRLYQHKQRTGQRA